MKRTTDFIVALAVGLAAKAATIEISNAEALRYLASSWSAENTYVLTADIELAGDFTPIGTLLAPFTAIFDGRGHTITGLVVNATADQTGYVAGLFGVIGSGGSVKDLMVGSTEVRINSSDGATSCYVGAVAGKNDGTIVGCANRGVNVFGNFNNANVGGIVGENTGSVENCYNLGLVYSSSSYTRNWLGGIVGNNNGTVKNCFARNQTAEGNSTVQPICGDNKTTISGCFYMNGTAGDSPAVTVLSNNTDNTSVISDANEQRKNVLLQNRTIYSDGYWNTLCLPFDIPASDNGRSPIAGASVKELNTETSGFVTSTGVLTLNFTDATNIVAGKPYIVKWDEAIDGDLSNPVFMDVTVKDVAPSPANAGNFSFIGLFSPVILTGGDKLNLYMGGGNTLYYPSKDITVGSCRAYFKLSTPAAVKSCVLNFGEGYGADCIKVLPQKWNEAKTWYTLDGVKLSAKPSTKGIYIQNGKKVAVK